MRLVVTVLLALEVVVGASCHSSSPATKDIGFPLVTRTKIVDQRLQGECERLLNAGGFTGAIVVLDANSGYVLAMASVPQEPNLCCERAYAPGATFNIVSVAAALEERVVGTDTQYVCSGHYQIGGVGRKWMCWRQKGHGKINLADALAFSCAAFFCRAVQHVGIEKLDEYAGRFGLGQFTGVHKGEVAGFVSSPHTKQEQSTGHNPDPPWERRWFDGDTIQLSVGQDDVSVTPVQNAAIMATIVNGGYRVVPTTTPVTPCKDGIGGRRVLSPDTVGAIRAGLRKCVAEGIGRAARSSGISVIGIHGTAVVAPTAHTDLDCRDQWNHSWFLAGVVDLQPSVSVCVLIEHCPDSTVTAPSLARDVIEFLYRERCQPPDHTNVHD